MVQRERSQPAETLANLPVVQFQLRKEWELWLKKNHASPTGVWLRIAKKSCGTPSVTYPEALEVALCYGWIDGQKRPDSEHAWLQKFTPRGKKSIWSKINRDKAIALIESGQMQAAGLREIERAKSDGRWEAAYDSARTATVPTDLKAALDRNPVAQQFFKTLDGANRYAVLFRIQTAKKAETRARKIEQLVAMLERQEKIHP
jgi:uncharacterized protein YdeI (YjbR/CyaY-like superfamily)